MSVTRKCLCAAAAAALLAIGGGSATAASLSISTGSISLRSLGKVTFEPELSEANVACNLTLNGSITRSIVSKIEGATIGTLTEATVRECTGGTVTFEGFPASITYESIEGVLPEGVTAINFKTSAMSRLMTNLLGQRCRFRAPMTLHAALTRRSGSSYTMSLVSNVVGARLALEEETLNTSITCPLGLRLIFGLGIPSPISITRL